MANRESTVIEITPEVLLKAYACGIFPMAESAEDPALYWIEPEMRGILPLDGFHLPSRLARTVRSDRFTVTVDRDFDAVLDGCASPLPGRPRTWINARIRTLYRKLHERRHCHSLEVYEGSDLVGGLYDHDWFMVARDFDSYAKAQAQVDATWRDGRKWHAMAIRNTAHMGWFSSDRTIRQYAEDIWKVPVGRG